MVPTWVFLCLLWDTGPGPLTVDKHVSAASQQELWNNRMSL